MWYCNFYLSTAASLFYNAVLNVHLEGVIIHILHAANSATSDEFRPQKRNCLLCMTELIIEDGFGSIGLSYQFVC